MNNPKSKDTPESESISNLKMKELFTQIKKLQFEKEEQQKKIDKLTNDINELANYETKWLDREAYFDGEMASYFSDIYNEICEEHHIKPNEEYRTEIYNSVSEAIINIF